MKSVKLIAAVFTLHIFVVIALLVQPGCQSMNNRHASSKKITIHEQMDAGIHEDFNAGMEINRPRMEPKRPADHIAKGESTQIEEEFIVDILEPLKALESTQTADAITVQESTEPEATSYEVKRGDNLWVISKKVGVPLSKIAKANGLHQDSILQIGQRLTIPTHASTANAQRSTFGASQTEVATNAQSTESTDYLVQRGDTLSTIASRMNTSIGSIKSANNMRSNVIYVGQKLKIPAASATQTESVAASSMRGRVSNEATYTVRPGQTLSDIAHITGVRVTELMEYNGINDPRRLRAEQVLKLKPATGATSMASSSTTIAAPKVVPQGTAAQQKAPTDVDSFFDSAEEIPWVPVESSEGNTTT